MSSRPLIRTLLRKARRLIPPALTRVVAPLVGRILVSYLPRASFADAAAEAGVGYEDPALLDGDTDERPAPNLSDMPDYLGPLIASIGVAATDCGRLHIIDFGGALGDLFNYVKAAFSNRLPMTWTVVETALYVEHGRKLCWEGIGYENSLDDVAAGDFALFSGALQYLDNWRAPLTHPRVLSAKYILITRTSLGPAEVPFLQVVNYPDKTVRYPARVIAANDIERVLTPTHRPLMSWNLEHDMGQLGICPAPATLWIKR
jgi:putative methyltransferase (TIGR04325 family)